MSRTLDNIYDVSYIWDMILIIKLARLIYRMRKPGTL